VAVANVLFRMDQRPSCRSTAISAGVLLWEIITGSRPVRGHMRSIQVPAECPRDAADLMTACCALDPAARPTARDLMKRLQAMLVAQKEGRRSEFDG
jgi:serine/threonine protein kinase